MILKQSVAALITLAASALLSQTPFPAARAGSPGAYLGAVTAGEVAEVSHAGVRLSEVRTGSPAEAAGLRAGDIIVRIGKYTIRNLDDFDAALQAYTMGGPTNIGYLREGTEKYTTATLLPRK